MEKQTTPVTDRFGRTIPAMTASESAVFQSVMNDVAATRHGVLTLDMRNQKHRQFVLDRFGGDDYLERYFPTTRNLVETTRLAHEANGGPGNVTLLEMDEPPTDAWVPLVNVAYLGVEPGGTTVTAQGIVTLPNMAATMTCTLTIVDNISGQQISTSTIPAQYNITTQTVEATGTLPQPAGDVDITATLTTQYLPAGATEAKQTVAYAKLLGAIAVQSITVLNPNHNAHPTRDYIKVGLNRTPQQVSDCDYYYSYGTDGNLQPIVGLQVNGSAQLVSGFTVSSNPNFNGSCILMRRSGTGAGATLAFPSDQIPSLCNGAGNTVNWNIGPDWFLGAPWNQGDIIDLDFTLNFNITPGGTTFVRVTSVPQAVTPPSNIASIAPMQFVWGCVAAGTLVRMADGSQRAIETLKIGERVADGHGHSLRIAEVWRGRESKPLYRLATASGAEVLVTDEHPLPTPAGVVLARDLAPGMMVTTVAGNEPLAMVELVSFDGPVVNLDLLPDDAASLADIDDDAITAFVAGGILVGDNRMQGVCCMRARTASGQGAFENLGAEWRLDIANGQRLSAGLPLIERIGT